MAEEIVYIPIQKSTGTRYPAISADEKLEMEKHPVTKGKYRFQISTKKRPQIAANISQPVEAKKAKPVKAQPTKTEDKPKTKSKAKPQKLEKSNEDQD